MIERRGYSLKISDSRRRVGRVNLTAPQGAPSSSWGACEASVSKDEAVIGASWFETALTRLLTMRVMTQ